jgi:TRAP transporter TAXI family solute receptor
MALYNHGMQLWLNKDIGVEKFADLKSKKVCFGVPGSPPFEMYTELAALAGFDEASSNAAGGKFVPLAWSEATSQLQDGNIDALFWFTSYPHPAIESISMGRSYDLMQIDKELLEEYKKTRNAFIDIELPAGTYTWQDNDVETIASAVCYVIRKDMPDDVVYNITKALYENIETFKNTHAGMRSMSHDSIGKGLVVQIHPGAAKFYDEVGVPYDKP